MNQNANMVSDVSCIHAADAGELNSCKVRLSLVHEFQALNLNKEMQFHQHKRKFKNGNGIFFFNKATVGVSG